MVKPDFSKTFAQNGALLPPTDSQYIQGFEYLGDNPPLKEEFNALFQQIDKKMQWLNNNHLDIAAPAVLATVDGIVTLPESGSSFIINGSENVTQIIGRINGLVLLRWNTARTIVHGASVILQGGVNRITEVGDVGIYEFSATSVREISYFTAVRPFDGNIRKNSHPYNVGDIAYSPKLPSWAYLECIQGGITAADDSILENISNGGG